MELQHLRYFLDIARFESISKAAQHNHVAQPALSRVVARLEQEFGVSLFDRVGRNIQLNTYGRILMEAAEDSLSTLDAVKEHIDFCAGQLTGNVKVCMHAPTWQFDKLCEDFREQHPFVELDVQNSVGDGAIQLSPNHDLFIYMGAVKHDGRYMTHRLLSQELVALVRTNHPLAARDNVTLQDLPDQELIIPRFPALRDIFYSYCYQAGFVPKIAGEVSLPSGQKTLLDTRAEKRVAILLRQVDGVWGEGYHTLPFVDPPCAIDITLAWSSANPLRPSAETFRDYVLDFYGSQ